MRLYADKIKKAKGFPFYNDRTDCSKIIKTQEGNITLCRINNKTQKLTCTEKSFFSRDKAPF